MESSVEVTANGDILSRASTWMTSPRRRRLSVAIGLAVILEVTFAAVQVPLVFGACMPARGPHDNVARYVQTQFDPSASLTGVSAAIKEYDPYYSGFNHTGTNATIMLESYAPIQSQWAQIGWFKSKLRAGVVHRESGLEFFRSPTDNNYRWFNSEPVGTFTRYAIYYNTSNGEYVFHIDGNIVDAWTGPFNPDRYWMFGETHDWADQMPGGTNTHEVFKEAYYYTGSSLNQHTQTAPITISSNKPVQWGATNPSAGRYEIWDKVCTN